MSTVMNLHHIPIVLVITAYADLQFAILAAHDNAVFACVGTTDDRDVFVLSYQGSIVCEEMGWRCVGGVLERVVEVCSRCVRGMRE